MIQFSENAEVLTANNDKLGTIDRIVLNPDTNDVAYLVIKRGFLDTRKKIVPIDMFDEVTEDRLVFRREVSSLEDFLDFEETHFLPYDFEGEGKDSKQKVPGRYLYWYPPYGGLGRIALPPFGVKTEENTPKGMVALEVGANVISKNDEKVGDVESVFADPDSNQATHILISSGFISKTRKLIPVNWIKETLEKEVHLFVDSKLIEKLPEYQVE